MARETQAKLQAQIAQLERGMQRAFLEAVRDIKSATMIEALDEALSIALETGDFTSVEAIFRLDQRVWAKLEDSWLAAFRAGGLSQLEALPKRRPNGGRLLLGFRLNETQTNGYVTQQTGALITNLNESTREVIRAVLVEGIQQNTPRRQIARQLIGSGSSRTGGALGLDMVSQGAVARTRVDLTTPDGITRYLQRGLRNRNYDALVKRARREGRGLSSADIAKVTNAYERRLLRHRAKTIANTESGRAFNAARWHALRQQVESGEIPADAVRREWRATIGSGRTRDTHLAEHGSEVGYGEPHVTSSGARLMFPGDTSLGAPGSETVNCRCTERVRVDWTKAAA